MIYYMISIRKELFHGAQEDNQSSGLGNLLAETYHLGWFSHCMDYRDFTYGWNHAACTNWCLMRIRIHFTKGTPCLVFILWILQYSFAIFL